MPLWKNIHPWERELSAIKRRIEAILGSIPSKCSLCTGALFSGIACCLISVLIRHGHNSVLGFLFTSIWYCPALLCLVSNKSIEIFRFESFSSVRWLPHWRMVNIKPTMPLCSVEEKSSKIFVSLIYVLKHFKSKHQPLNPSPSLPIIPIVTRRSTLGFDWHTKTAWESSMKKMKIRARNKVRNERTVAHKAFLELLSEPNNQLSLSLKFDEKIYRQYCEDNNLSLCDALSSLPGLKLSVTVKPYYYEIEHLNPRTPPPLPRTPNFTNKLLSYWSIQITWPEYWAVIGQNFTNKLGPTDDTDRGLKYSQNSFFRGKNRNLNRLILAKPSQTLDTMEVSLIWCK